ncbi:hypothetical protein ACRALDRAFT_1072476 [Sodiomyces alcalophilus JCM 7366]|uniref:uncharacterized protein n=1 Tax=Sodiomyces alcalophilus JCM 7366 TaxID=591952 RepID=UPI0039B367D5
MPTYKTSQEWLKQSTLLIQSSPSTTRVTTTYYVKPPKTRPAKPTATPGTDADTPMTDAPALKGPRGRLVLKTYDPTIGVTLRYRTHKAAEVSRLILAVGRLSNLMAGLPEVREEEMTDAPAAADAATPGTKVEEPTSTEERKPTPQPQQSSSQSQQQQQQKKSQQGGGGGGGKKKKKGKK